MPAALGLGLGLNFSGRVPAENAVSLLGNEWIGFTLDFISDSFATRTAANEAETLLGTGPATAEVALGVSFTDNSYALGTA